MPGRPAQSSLLGAPIPRLARLASPPVASDRQVYWYSWLTVTQLETRYGPHFASFERPWHAGVVWFGYSAKRQV
jgi:hypothetical protein